MAFEDYYAKNPISVVDQNKWDDRVPEVAMQFLTGAVVYTPLITWDDRSARTGAESTIYTEMIEGDVDFDDIAYDAQYITDPLSVDSRQRKTSMKRYGDKVQLHKVSNYFQMWRMTGGRDWKPILRGVLGNNVRRKIEMISRNAYLAGLKTWWTYGGNATNFNELDATCKFSLDNVNRWNLGLSQTGTPVVPNGLLTDKIVVVPPGCVFDFQESLYTASNNEAALWYDARKYGSEALRYEVGSWKNTRFIEAPNDRYGFNPAVLYNAGQVEVQYKVTAAITAGDGAPDPETTQVDGTWYVGQKDATHYIQLEAFSPGDFAVHDIVTLHTLRTNQYGVTNGVEFRSGKTVNRRVVAVDESNYRLAFDRPIMKPYTTDLDSPNGTYGYVTKGAHVGFCLAQGAGGAIHGSINKPLEFYEPKPIDDFESVWRFVWDILGGTDVWEPHAFEAHFVSVTVPKPGGVISPPAAGS